MKILFFCLLTVSLLAQNTESWVRQTDLSTGQIYDTFIDEKSGKYITPLKINKEGAMFELFARGTAWDNNIYLLDTKIVGTYNPQVVVDIVSEDPYLKGEANSLTYVKRTRADRPFAVNIQVQGLAGNELTTKYIYFNVQGKNYDAKTYSSLNREQYLIEESNLTNGTYNLNPLYHQLTSSTISSGNGEQTFTFVRYSSYNVPDTVLAQPKIEIWPLASATINNITPKQVFIDRIPSIIIEFNHLYPDSHTFIQIYKGNQVLGTKGKIVDGTEIKYGSYYNQTDEATNIPQNLTLTINDLSNYASADGLYTLEVITHTPFFNRTMERLKYITFEVDRVISSRGRFSTLE